MSGELAHLAAGPLPDLSVIELAIVIALLRRGPLNRDALAKVIADWLARAVTPRELYRPVARMIRRGWLVDCDHMCLAPTAVVQAQARQLYAAFIRMLAEERNCAGSDRARHLIKHEGDDG